VFENKQRNSHTPLAKTARANFTTTIENKKIKTFLLINKNGLELCVTNYGLRVISFLTPDKNNNFDDIVLGFNSIENYKTKEGKYFGSIVGQYANRIKNGTFYIDGVKYNLDTNDGENHIHGGKLGFNDIVWSVTRVSNKSIEFQCFFSDGQNGYPGNLDVRVTYALTDENEFKIKYEATTDKTTIINLSHHSYFNLKGEGNGSIKDHILTINSDYFTPINHQMIPVNKHTSVSDSAFDFRRPKVIGKNMMIKSKQIEISKGFDHNYVLRQSVKNNEGLTFAARVEEKMSGRVLEVYTSEPGIQFYSGNFLTGSLIGKSNEYYYQYGGFCLETQHFPNAPNIPEFPSTFLYPDATYTSTTVYKFSIIK
jgi:aldose 1-epimerase